VKLLSEVPPGGRGRRAFLFFSPGICGGVVSSLPMPYTAAREHHMTLLNKIFTTRTLLQIIFVLAATVILKATSSHYDFSWATVLAAG
jgi:hypothetical protein